MYEKMDFVTLGTEKKRVLQNAILCTFAAQK